MRVTNRHAAATVAAVSLAVALGPAMPAGAQDIGPEAVGNPVVLAESDGVDGFDRFGAAVAVSGDLLVVGASEDKTLGENFSGAAYIYERSDDGWTLQTKVLPRVGADPYQFGAAVAIAGETIFVGSPYEDRDGETFVGSVYVYERVSGQWARTAVLSSPDPAEYEQFGTALAADGDTLVVNDGDDSREGDNVSRVDVFLRTDAGWVFDSEVYAPQPEALGEFGRNLALDGDTLLVGQEFADTYSTRDGAAYIYTRVDGTWQHTAKLSEPGLKRKAYFGTQVALDGDTAVVSTSDAYTKEQAKVFVYVRSAQGWTRQTRLVAPRSEDAFGRALAIDGNNLLVGAPRLYPVNDAGVVYRYQRTGQIWSPRGKISSPQPDVGDAFGTAIAVSDNNLAITAVFDDEEGATFVYDR